MKRNLLILLAVTIISALVFTGCGQPAPAPAPKPAPTPAPAPAPAPEAKFELRYTTQWPEQSPHYKTIQSPILKEITEKSNGRVTFKVFSGAVLGGGAEQYDIVRTGKADMGTTSTGYTPGRFPISEVLSLPGAFANTYDQHKMVLSIFDRIVKEDFPDNKVTAMLLSDGFWLYTKTQIKTLEDLKGLKTRSGGGLITPTLEALGATAISMPVSDVYTSLQTGVIGGAITGPTAIPSFKLNDIVSHELQFIFGWATDIYMVNLDTWNKLPPDLQKIIEDATRKGGIYQVDVHDAVSPSISKEFIAKGGSAAPLSDAENARWIKILTQVVNKWVTDMEAKGKPGNKALGIVREEAKKFNVPLPY